MVFRWYNYGMGQIKTYDELRTALVSRGDEKYREFIMRGIPSERPFLGVRIPEIRRIVADIPPTHYKEFLAKKPMAFEEVIARGIIVAKLPYDEMMDYFDSQILEIDDWCTCDTFCSYVNRKIKKQKEDFLNQKIEALLVDEREFAVRAGLVLLKCGNVKEDYLHLIFDRVESLAEREEYYIRMAIAWLVAECFIKFPEVTMEYLKVSSMPKWTFNKTISKICDSYRVEDEMKDTLRQMRKK